MANHKKKSIHPQEKRDEDEVKARLDFGKLSLGGLWNGLGNLMQLVAKMGKEGKEEYRQERSVRGFTPEGREVQAVYGVRIRTGIGKAAPSAEPAGKKEA